jgi:uncharacterized membrane protein
MHDARDTTNEAGRDTTPALLRTLGTAGRMFYAIAMLAFGLFHIGYGDFVTRVVPWWPAWIPGRSMWAYAVGVLLIGAGTALLRNWRTVTVSMLFASGLLLSFVLLGLPLVAKDAVLGGSWTVAGKVLAFAGGALLLARGWRVGVWFFAAFLVLCGIQHFLYINFVVSLIPTWIPAARFWAYAAGVFLIAGGLGLIVPATSRTAGLLSGLMIFSWVFLIHIPLAARNFRQTTNDSTAVFEALAMSGIAWLAAQRSSTD